MPTADKPNGGKSQQPDDEAYWERKQFKVQRLIAFAGVLGLVVYSFQLWEMQKATKSSTDGLALTREMARLDQRAWVAPVDMTLVKPAAVDKPLETKILFKNTGKTFATQLRIMVFSSGRSVDDPMIDFCEGIENRVVSGHGSVLVLAPNADYVAYSRGFDLTSEQVEAWNAGKIIWYVYGRISYNDVFNCEHWTNFASSMTIHSRQFESADRCNDADNNPCP